MKQIPKTPVEFDYDLWTTTDGKCMVRVKATGEVTEIDRKVMKILRTEEKRLGGSSLVRLRKMVKNAMKLCFHSMSYLKMM